MTPRRVDLNQTALVQYARNCGVKVQHLHEVGHGCPDLLCSFGGTVFVVEVKAVNGMLTPDEARWHEWFGAPIHIWRTAADVVKTLETFGGKG